MKLMTMLDFPKLGRYSPSTLISSHSNISSIPLNTNNSTGVSPTRSLEDSSDKFKALFYCTLLAFQFGLQPLIASRLTPPGVSKSSVVVATEIAKILIAFVSIMGESKMERKILIENWSLSDSIKLAFIPATLYAIQNLFVQYGYSYLDSMTFNLLNQTKVFSLTISIIV